MAGVNRLSEDTGRFLAGRLLSHQIQYSIFYILCYHIEKLINKVFVLPPQMRAFIAIIGTTHPFIKIGGA